MRTSTITTLMLAAFTLVTPAVAHEVFTEALEAHYGLKSVICSACHPNSKDRTVNNALGHLVQHKLAGQQLTARLEAAKAEGEAATEAMEKEIAAALIAVWPEIAAQTMTIDQQFRFGLVNGSRLSDEAKAELQPMLQEASQAETFTWPQLDGEKMTPTAETASAK